MPELPEIHNFVRLIQEHAGITFVQVEHNSHKSPAPSLFGPSNLTASARGKELRLSINPTSGQPSSTLVFNHGLEGKWVWTEPGQTTSGTVLLAFVANNGGRLSLVDNMRMATWHPGDFDQAARGPDPVTELAAFVRRVRENANHRDFAKPIGEVLLNQKYFNGIGNYLRAEVLARACVSPHLPARDLFTEPQYKEKGDLVLALCHLVPAEVMADRSLNKYGTPAEKERFKAWLKCYGKAQSEKDKGGRTIWFFADQASRDPSEQDRTKARQLLSNINSSGPFSGPQPSSAPAPAPSSFSAFTTTSIPKTLGNPAGLFGTTMTTPSMPTMMMSMASATATTGKTYPTKTKLLVLLGVLSRERLIDEAAKAQLKSIVIGGGDGSSKWLPKLEACVEYFEAEGNLDEVAETLRLVAQRVR